MSDAEKKKRNRARLKTIGRWAAVVALAAYLVVGFIVTRREAERALCTGIRVSVYDPQHTGFVTAREVSRELGDLPGRAKGMALSSIDTESLRRRLESIDKIEEVSIIRTTDGLISVSVTPLVPIMRVFDGDESYYVNKVGKRISANARYHIDVPVVMGHFPPSDTLFTPLSLTGLLDYIGSHTPWKDLITMVKVDGPEDIMLVPAIDGHIINFGTATDFDSKFRRLGRVYREVMSVKGWNYYDTLSVKWGGQLVASRRHRPNSIITSPIDDDDDDADVTTMLAAEGVAPGQTLPGREANSETPIPLNTPTVAPSSTNNETTNNRNTNPTNPL